MPNSPIGVGNVNEAELEVDALKIEHDKALEDEYNDLVTIEDNDEKLFDAELDALLYKS